MRRECRWPMAKYRRTIQPFAERRSQSNVQKARFFCGGYRRDEWQLRTRWLFVMPKGTSWLSGVGFLNKLRTAFQGRKENLR